MAETYDRGRVGILRRTIMVYAVVFVLWGLYRLLFRLPVLVEEFVFKPLVFFPPVLSVLSGEGKNLRSVVKALGFRREGLSLAVYYGLTLGVVYLLAVRLGAFVFSDGGVVYRFSLPPDKIRTLFVVAFFTALWEQILFSGFMLLRFMKTLRDEWSSVSLASLLFAFLHVPLVLLESDAQPVFVAIQLLILFLVGFGNAVLMLRTRNIFAPVLSHAFWAVAVGLFV